MPVARPAILRRVGDHARPDRVQLDVALAKQEIRLGLHQGGFVPAVPEGSRAPVAVVDILHVLTPHGDNDLRNRYGACGRDQQMDVVGHQNVEITVTEITVTVY